MSAGKTTAPREIPEVVLNHMRMHEGSVNYLYDDTTGKRITDADYDENGMYTGKGMPTWGRGHAVGREKPQGGIKKKYTKEEIDAQFLKDVEVAQANVDAKLASKKKLREFRDNMTSNQYGVLVDMMFNMTPAANEKFWKNVSNLDKVDADSVAEVISGYGRTNSSTGKKEPRLEQRVNDRLDIWNSDYTTDDIKAFQEKHGLTPDGKVGAKTREALKKAGYSSLSAGISAMKSERTAPEPKTTPEAKPEVKTETKPEETQGTEGTEGTKPDVTMSSVYKDYLSQLGADKNAADEENEKIHDAAIKNADAQLKVANDEATNIETNYGKQADTVNKEADDIIAALNTQHQAALGQQGDYTKLVDGWVKAAETNAENQRIANEKADKNTAIGQVFGGAVEAAAALINLGYTTKGALNTPMQSQQGTWAERADRARRERDAKLQSLQQQKETLARHRAQLLDKFSSDNAAHEANVARIKAEADANSAKIRLQGASTASTLRSKATAAHNSAIASADATYQTNKGYITRNYNTAVGNAQRGLSGALQQDNDDIYAIRNQIAKNAGFGGGWDDYATKVPHNAKYKWSPDVTMEQRDLLDKLNDPYNIEEGAWKLIKGSGEYRRAQSQLNGAGIATPQTVKNNNGEEVDWR